VPCALLFLPIEGDFAFAILGNSFLYPESRNELILLNNHSSRYI
jgi:hypothetical protein